MIAGGTPREEAARCTPGELWAREQLALLRDDGFSVPAIGGFIDEAAARARQTRRARPDLVRQSRRWTGAGAATWVSLAAIGVQPFRRRLAAGVTWWAAVALMVDWHLGMLETEEGRERRLGPADALTLTRAWLVPVLADASRPGVVVAAAATDLLDGIAARATAPTRAGRDLEGMVDGAAAAAALLGARRSDAISPAAASCEAVRLTAGLAYGAHAYLARASPPDPAVTRASRASTPLRVAGLLVAATGRRRLAGTLLAAGSLIGLGASARGHVS